MSGFVTSSYISKNQTGRRFAIGDIHGCYETFKLLLFNQLKIKKDDQIFLLGDYIGKGPKSKKVINLIIKLINEEYSIFPLKGNHEQVIMNIMDTEKYLTYHLKETNSLNLIKKGHLRRKIVKFFQVLPYYFELDNYYLVHAGINLTSKKPFSDFESMLWMRNPKEHIKTDIIKNKTLIHGHTPADLDVIIDKISKRKQIIGIDNGVYMSKKIDFFPIAKIGNLLALNLDTYELHIQPNAESILNLNKYSVNLSVLPNCQNKDSNFLYQKQIRDNLV